MSKRIEALNNKKGWGRFPPSPSYVIMSITSHKEYYSMAKKRSQEKNQEPIDFLEDEAKYLYGHLFYMKLYEGDLEAFIEHDISKQGQRLYVFYALNLHTYTEHTEALSDAEIAVQLKTHRTTIMRARAELEDAGLIVPSEKTINQKHKYHLPSFAKIGSRAAEKSKENEAKAKEKAYAKEKASVENVLSRRLSQPEMLRLRKKYGLF